MLKNSYVYVKPEIPLEEYMVVSRYFKKTTAIDLGSQAMQEGR
jgi:hypothetical protein